MAYPVGYVLTAKGWRALFQPQLDALSDQIRQQLRDHHQRDQHAERKKARS